MSEEPDLDSEVKTVELQHLRSLIEESNARKIKLEQETVALSRQHSFLISDAFKGRLRSVD